MSTATLAGPATRERISARSTSTAPARVGCVPARPVRRSDVTSAPAGLRPERGARPDTVRPADRRPVRQAPDAGRVRGTRCAAAPSRRHIVARRRAAAAAIMVGGALAALVWVVGIVGSNYAASVTPAPVGTEVVHVRAGDSLSSIASRVAPGVPQQAVIDQIVARNDLSGSGLHVGQALVAPAYR